ncbi:MAG TPA: protein-disulfide reductase DsbD domain-containing protein [Acidisoma sp.]|uniref:protein-disulfide reductase DsbD family protein n=1 Tax=Acidisoma sp. TaxID=1872115 RepID=UPI002BC1A308|nr:protein-disulfide reductase DsbD domain-containing protein [Acidisoma sp.]HTI02168.1 protein-disulfide reductase DsbD domain-containing protein [Acidisoma sp.]
MTHSGGTAKFSCGAWAARILLTALVLLVALGASQARAAHSLAASTLNNEVKLVSNVDAVVPGQPFRIGLFFGLGQKWHIYWSNPGDAGASPSMTLTLPEGGVAGPIQWPIPKVMNDGPVTSYGYTRKMVPVLLPLTVTPPKTIAGSTYHLQVAAHWLVCKDICVPGSADFELALPVQAKSVASAEAPLFQAVDRRMPAAKGWKAWIQPDGTLSVDGADASSMSVTSAYFFPEQPGVINQDFYQSLRMQDGRVTLRLKPDAGFKPDAPLQGLLVLTAPDRTETAGRITAQPGIPPVEMPQHSFWGALVAALTSGRYLDLVGAAFLGGLILNLMPCVFPVLAMKAAHLSQHAHGEAERNRRGGLAYGLGVILSFLLLGALLLGLREGGAAAGWGFQFQSPAFVLAIAWLLFAVGLSFSGVVEIGGRWMGLGHNLTTGGGLGASFCSGVLAAVVATPCTAPFMGAAIAAALAGPPLPGLLIFLALGLGLALPMVILSVIPGIGRILPRPGRWMVVLHQALAFPIYATVLWLVWVAAQEGGPSLLLAVGAGLLLIAFAAWAWQLGGRLAGGLALIAVLALAPVLWEARDLHDASPLPTSAQAEPFSTARLAALRAAGKPAFVNLTAAWCVTCLVNNRVALDRAAVQLGFRREGVTYLVGDWTKADPAITAYLKAHGRDGVPLYVYYPPAGGQPVVLPQLLTPYLVLKTIGATTDGTSGSG